MIGKNKKAKNVEVTMEMMMAMTEMVMIITFDDEYQVMGKPSATEWHQITELPDWPKISNVQLAVRKRKSGDWETVLEDEGMEDDQGGRTTRGRSYEQLIILYSRTRTA